MPIFVVFAVGVGNFSSRRMPMQDYVRATNQKLSLLDSKTRILDWHYATGNLVVQAPDIYRMKLVDELSLALGTPCAILTIEELAGLIAVAKKVASPPAEPGFRWTKGIAFRVSGRPCTGTLKPTTHAVFFPISKHAVGVFKKDRLADGTDALDREERGGGWGAISADINKAVGGTWTSRALDRAEGLLEKARRYSLTAP